MLQGCCLGLAAWYVNEGTFLLLFLCWRGSDVGGVVIAIDGARRKGRKWREGMRVEKRDLMTLG